MVALPLICKKHRNAWKGWMWKAKQPFPEEHDLLCRDAAAAQTNLSARCGQSHLEVERLSNGELFKSLTITHFLLFCLCHVKYSPLLNCPWIAAESIRLVLQAGGGGRSQELPGEADDFHQQLVNPEQHLLGSHSLRSLMFQLAIQPGMWDLSVLPFQLSGQEITRKPRLVCFPVLWLGGLVSLAELMPSGQFALHPPGCGVELCARRGWMRNDRFCYFCSCFQANPWKPEPTSGWSSQGDEGEKLQDPLPALYSGIASRSSEHSWMEERC